LVALIADEVSAGSTALAAEVAESDTGPIDLLATRFRAVVERGPAEPVRAEVKAVHKAQEAAKHEASKARLEQKMAKLTGATQVSSSKGVVVDG
jgi:hypothetical protein